MNLEKLSPAFAALVRQRHQGRIDNYRRIFAEFAGKQFDVRAIADLLGMAMPGGRKYRCELTSLGLAKVVSAWAANTNMPTVYELTTDQADIEAFFVLLNEGMSCAPRAERKPEKVAPAPKPEPFVRAVHVIADDEFNKRRAAKVVVHRHWMDVALFGPAPGASC